MPEAVLAGPDGSPAIDAMTGMPLTMEELLRRRGILAHRGVVSPLNQSVASPAAPSSVVDPTAGAAQSAMDIVAAEAASGLDPTSVAGAIPTTNSMPIAPPAPDDSSMWPWLAGGAGVAAALYGARKLRGRGGNAAVDAVAGEGPRVNPNLYRDPTIIDAEYTEIPNERIGSNRPFDKTIDPKGVAHAGSSGAGPKALSGPAPVTDVSNDGNSVRNELARRNIRGALPDQETRRRPATRMENAARQANNSRVQPPGTDPIRLADSYSDLDDAEMAVARQLASRIRTDRGRPNSNVARAPVYDQGSELAEAVAIVRAQRAAGTNTAKILPLIRRLR